MVLVVLFCWLFALALFLMIYVHLMADGSL